MNPISTSTSRLAPFARRAAALLLALAIVPTGLAGGGQALAYGGDGLREAANAYRTSGGLDPVHGSSLLDNISTHRAQQMADAQKLEHDMDYVIRRLNGAGQCWTGVGEIIALNWGAYSYQNTVGQWWNSPTHHAIMVNPDYNYAGGAWQTAPGGANYSVMVFATLCGSSERLSSVSLLKVERAYDPDRRMVFVRGRHVGLKLSAKGAVLERKTVRFSSRKTATAAGRTTVDGRAYLKVSSGPLAGWWVHESGRQFARGMTANHKFADGRRLRFEAGRYTAYRFDRLGRVTRSRTLSLAAGARRWASSRAIINGRPWFRITGGRWDRMWVRDTARVDVVG